MNVFSFKLLFFINKIFSFLTHNFKSDGYQIFPDIAVGGYLARCAAEYRHGNITGFAENDIVRQILKMKTRNLFSSC